MSHAAKCARPIACTVMDESGQVVTQYGNPAAAAAATGPYYPRMPAAH
jgi:hypothetical protein